LSISFATFNILGTYDYVNGKVIELKIYKARKKYWNRATQKKKFLVKTFINYSNSDLVFGQE